MMNDVKYRKYSVSDVARVLGLTPASLHYYERENLIHVKKDEKGYRYYSMVDVFRLLSYHKYHSMGFPIKTVVAQFSGSENNRDIIIERVQKIKEKCDQQVIYYQQLSGYINDYLESIKQINTLHNNYEFIRSQEVLFLYDEYYGWISREQNAQGIEQQWIAAMPATKLSVMCLQWTKELQPANVTFGYSVSPQIAQDISLNLGLKTKKIEATSCLHTIVSTNDDFSDNPGISFVEPMKYLKERGLILNGNPWGNILLVEVAPGAKLKPYVEYWFPIR